MRVFFVPPFVARRRKDGRLTRARVTSVGLLPQEAALHQELHPHPPVRGVHSQSRDGFHQRRGSVRGRGDGGVPGHREYAATLARRLRFDGCVSLIVGVAVFAVSPPLLPP